MKVSKKNIKWTEKKTDCKVDSRNAIEWEKVWTPYKVGEGHDKRKERLAESQS
jgi:hypothetical protein